MRVTTEPYIWKFSVAENAAVVRAYIESITRTSDPVAPNQTAGDMFAQTPPSSLSNPSISPLRKCMPVDVANDSTIALHLLTVC